MKYTTAMVFLILISGQALAQNIGSIAYESEKSGPGSAEYTIGIFNLGDETYQVEMRSRGFEGTLEFEENPFVLEPSEVSSNPSGEGWYSISGNKYVKPREQKVDVRTDKSQNFSVEAVFTNPDQNSSGGAEVIQILSNPLTFHKTGAPGFRNHKSEDEDQNQGLELEKSNNEEKEKNNSQSFSEKTVDRILGSNETYANESVNQEENSENGFDHLTGLLAAGAAGSILYLWSVI